MYVDIVISNVFHLNKHFFFLFIINALLFLAEIKRFKTIVLPSRQGGHMFDKALK